MRLTTRSALFFISLLLIIVTSCIPLWRQNYLRSYQKQDTTTVFKTPPNKPYLVKSGDFLYIRIISLDEKTNNIFNLGSANTGGNNNYYMMSYAVDEDGYIQMPLLGKIMVKDKNMNEISALMQKLVDEYLKGSSVIVKLVSFSFTMLGEVNTPGNYQVFEDKINVFEALAMAGDLTPWGNKRNVKLVRELEGKTKIYKIDLNDKHILESEFYYLKPNDIVYVESMKGKQWGFETFPYAMFFSTVSFLMVIFKLF